MIDRFLQSLQIFIFTIEDKTGFTPLLKLGNKVQDIRAWRMK